MLSDAPVQQAFAKHLPDGGQELPRQDILPNQRLLHAVEALNPIVILDYRDGEQRQHTQTERYNK